VVLILTLCVNVPVVAIWLNATPLLVALGQDQDIADKVADYARIRILGLFMQAVTCVAMKTLTAMGKTKVLLYVNLLGIVVALALTWLFISADSPFSSFFVSPVDGSAWASTLLDSLSAGVLLGCCICDSDCQRCWSGFSYKAWAGWGAYLKISVPAMLMGIFEWWSWDIVNFLAGLCPHPKSTLATNALLGSIISLPYCLKFEPNTKPDPEISLDPTACILRFRWSQHVWGHRACLGSHVLAMVTWLPAVMASARGPRPWWGMPWGHRSLDWHAASHS